MKILVVDDSSVMRKLVTRSIRQAGFGDADIVEAADGLLAIAASEEHQPDLILADWNMPNMTGLEMLKSLRQQGSWVKVGFITSESKADSRDAAEEAGASFFLSKPIDAEALRAALDGV